MSNKIRKVFLDDLPHKQGKGANTNKLVIDWSNSVGYYVPFIYEDITGCVKIANYNSENYTLIIKYKDKECTILIGEFSKCRLGRILNRYTKEFKIDIGTILKDSKRNLEIIDREYREKTYKNNKTKWKYYKHRCIKCGYETWNTESALLTQNIGCACCSNQVPVLGKNTIYDTDKWMISYIGEEVAKSYTHGSEQKVVVKCIECGRTKKLLINKLYQTHSMGCPCGDGKSYPNKIAFKVLEELEVKFEAEKKFNWCVYNFKNKLRQGIYDFYFELDNKKYILEMDGGFHFINNNRNGQTVEESKKIDNHKDKLALEREIEVIRIDCFNSDLDYIKKNILKSKLNEIFDLSNVDWIKVNSFTLSNLVKTACEYKRDNPNLTAREISKLMNLDRHTVRKYLIKGSKIGWCNYDREVEIKKSNKKNGEMLKQKISRRVYQYDLDGNFMKCWESSSECGHNGFTQTNVSACCLGKLKKHKGYIWSYTPLDSNFKFNRHTKQCKRVYQYTKDLKLIKVWNSTIECGQNGFIQTSVSLCCLGKQKTHKGYIWSYTCLNDGMSPTFPTKPTLKGVE